jgi:hypothetical protein
MDSSAAHVYYITHVTETYPVGFDFVVVLKRKSKTRDNQQDGS